MPVYSLFVHFDRFHIRILCFKQTVIHIFIHKSLLYSFGFYHSAWKSSMGQSFDNFKHDFLSKSDFYCSLDIRFVIFFYACGIYFSNTFFFFFSHHGESFDLIPIGFWWLMEKTIHNNFSGQIQEINENIYEKGHCW